jgi:hypothetical protein
VVSGQKATLMADAARLESEAASHGPQPLEPLEMALSVVHPGDVQQVYATITAHVKQASRALSPPSPAPAHVPGRRPTLGSPMTPRALPPPMDLVAALLGRR